MSDEHEQPIRSRQETRSPVGAIPVDVVTGWFLLGLALLVGRFYPDSSIQVALFAPVLFFLPGYVTVAAVFPQRETAPKAIYPSRVTLGERLALSFGLSIILLPMLGLVVGALPLTYTYSSVSGVLGAYVVGIGTVAGIRRLRLPADHRFAVPLGRWAAALGDELRRGSVLERIMTLALCLSILLAIGAAGYALAVPNYGESFTDFHLVTEDENDDLVADDYPTELTRGEPASYTVGIHNHEGESVDYEIVVTLDRVIEEEGVQRVVETDELGRMDATVAPDERWTESHTIEPSLVGDDLRLTYYLYVGEAPDNPDSDSAYRHLHVWVDVAE